jgi:hypothetical protein
VKTRLVNGTVKLVMETTCTTKHDLWVRGSVQSGEWKAVPDGQLGRDLSPGVNYVVITETIDSQSLDTVDTYSVGWFRELDEARSACLNGVEELCKFVDEQGN